MKFNWEKSTLRLLKNWPEESLFLEKNIDPVKCRPALYHLEMLLTQTALKRIPLYYFSKPIVEVVQNNFEKLTLLLPELSPRYSCHILDQSFCIINHITEGISFHYMIFNGHFVNMISIEVTEDSKVISKQASDDDKVLNECTSMAIKALLMETFLEYAETETIILDSAQKKSYKAIIGGEKMTSRNGLPLKIIDSKYFRNIIRTEGFKVRGHFRMQPYGPGLSKKKLIWIDEFEKNGYVSKVLKEKVG